MRPLRHFIWMRCVPAAACVLAFLGFAGAPETSSTRGGGELATTFVVFAVVVQVALGAALWHAVDSGGISDRWARRPRSHVWSALTWWYLISAVLGASVAGALVRDGHPSVIGTAFVIGAFSLATTADTAITALRRGTDAAADIVVFLVSTHVLATLVLCAYIVVTMDTQPGDILQEFVQGGTVTLTILAIPVCAGIHARLRTAAHALHAVAPVRAQNPREAPTVRGSDLRSIAIGTATVLLTLTVTGSGPL